jgi:membrane-bound serine protease (ClpP class)
VGTTGVVVSPLSPQGRVRLHGETWKARTEGGDLLKDGPVEVLGTEGLTLIVRRLSESDADLQKKQT